MLHQYTSTKVRIAILAPAVALAAWLVVAPVAAFGDDHGVAADRSVEPVPLSSFDGISPGDIWDRINGLAYWAIPLTAPTGYYESTDDSSTATFGQTVREVINQHRVVPYTRSLIVARRRESPGCLWVSAQ